MTLIILSPTLLLSILMQYLNIWGILNNSSLPLCFRRKIRQSVLLRCGQFWVIEVRISSYHNIRLRISRIELRISWILNRCPILLCYTGSQHIIPVSFFILDPWIFNNYWHFSSRMFFFVINILNEIFIFNCNGPHHLIILGLLIRDGFAVSHCEVFLLKLLLG